MIAAVCDAAAADSFCAFCVSERSVSSSLSHPLQSPHKLWTNKIDITDLSS